MPSSSEAQRKAAGVALAAKKGEKDPDELTGASKEMYDSMSEEELKEFVGSIDKDASEDNPLNQFLQQRQQEQQSVRKEAEEIIDYRLRKVASQ